jgi:hypothetical protein
MTIWYLKCRDCRNIFETKDGGSSRPAKVTLMSLCKEHEIVTSELGKIGHLISQTRRKFEDVYSKNSQKKAT